MSAWVSQWNAITKKKTLLNQKTNNNKTKQWTSTAIGMDMMGPCLIDFSGLEVEWDGHLSWWNSLIGGVWSYRSHREIIEIHTVFGYYNQQFQGNFGGLCAWVWPCPASILFQVEVYGVVPSWLQVNKILECSPPTLPFGQQWMACGLIEGLIWKLWEVQSWMASFSFCM